MDRQLINVLLLGAAFHLIYLAYQTSEAIQQTVVNSIKLKPNNKFTGNGYLALCVTQATYAIFILLAPALISLTGIKYGMFFASLTFIIYPASFIYPITWIFYVSAALVGFGMGIIWASQGTYLTRNSNTETSVRNSAIFWCMFQSSLIVGSIFVYFAFNGEANVTISDKTRYLIYTIFTLVSIVGSIIILTLKDTQPQTNDTLSNDNIPSQVEEVITTSTNDDELNDGSIESRLESCEKTRRSIITEMLEQILGLTKMAKTRNMLLLDFTFLYTGVSTSFYFGVFGTAIGATPDLGPHSKEYIGLIGIFAGFGEILGAIIIGILGKKVKKRETIVILGYLLIMIAYAFVYVSLPPDSPLVYPAKESSIIRPRISIILISTILIGFGDAFINTQLFSLLMSAYNDEPVAAFTLMNFVQSIGGSVAFFYSTVLGLYGQMYVLAILASLATFTFSLIERNLRSEISIYNKLTNTARSDSSVVKDLHHTPVGSVNGESFQQQQQASPPEGTA